MHVLKDAERQVESVAVQRGANPSWLSRLLYGCRKDDGGTVEHYAGRVVFSNVVIAMSTSEVLEFCGANAEKFDIASQSFRYTGVTPLRVVDDTTQPWAVECSVDLAEPV